MNILHEPEQILAVRHPEIGRAANDPVRVCFLIDELALAGTETQLLALIRHLDRGRVRPYLCVLGGQSPLSRSLEPDNCPTLRLGVKQLSRLTAIRAAWQFQRFLRSERIDVLQTYFPDSTYFGIPIARVAGVPCRLRTRNNLGHWLTATHRILGRLLNALTTHTIVNCVAARSALLEHERPDPQGVYVLENGVDLERFADVPPLRPKPPGERLVVGLIGNLRVVKGIDLLVEAARRLRPHYPHVCFCVAGEGECRAALERLIRQHELTAHFELRGRVENVPAFLADIDVAVLCSHAEGMPNAVLEYMAAGRPIVATKVGAVADLLEDGVHGLVIPPRDVSALTGALARLFSEDRLARALGEAARERVRQRYSREAMVRRFEEFYEAIASRGVE